MTTWSQFYPYVQPYVPGVPSVIVDHALNTAAITFFSDSGLLIETLSPIPVAAGVSRYELTPETAGTTVEQVKGAWYNGRQLSYVAMDELAQRPTFWQDETGTPKAFTQDNPDEIILFPVPDTALPAGLKVIVVLKPTLGASGVPDWIFKKYVAEIADGAKAQLMLMPGAAWSNPQLGAYHQQLFEKAKGNARLDANRNFTRTSPKVNLRAIT